MKGKVKKLFLNKNEYQITTLSKENKLATFTVHQLVAQEFVPRFVKGNEINHCDGNKSNNTVSNLELSNPSHNMLYANVTGLRPKQGISRYRNVSYLNNPRAKSKWAGSIRHAGKGCFGWKEADPWVIEGRGYELDDWKG